ncbi:hypothetical protein [Massilia sp. PWRC2]|uniref:hypothetical protein n=1 Tax=Massilia sp. PWRC2 TaxID=2804626 RepID=UPI003CEDD450
MMHTAIDWVPHLDTHLAALTAVHGYLIYAVLFTVIFVETGVVVLPFLPGDSLLFVSGALAAQGTLSAPFLAPLLIFAAIGGDALNFAIGSFTRKRAVDNRIIVNELSLSIDNQAKNLFVAHGTFVDSSMVIL